MLPINGSAIKTSNQTVTNNVMAFDNELSFSMLTNKAYNVELFIAFTVSGLLPSYRWTITGPTNSNHIVIQNDLVLLGAVSIISATTTAYGTISTSPALTTSTGTLKINAAAYTGNTNDNFSFNFCCASGTSVTTLAGSYLRYTYL